MPNADGMVLGVLLRAAPKALKPKHQRKLFELMRDELRAGIPENGVGPVISIRREAVQVLECMLRLLAKAHPE